MVGWRGKEYGEGEGRREGEGDEETEGAPEGEAFPSSLGDDSREEKRKRHVGEAKPEGLAPHPPGCACLLRAGVEPAEEVEDVEGGEAEEAEEEEGLDACRAEADGSAGWGILHPTRREHRAGDQEGDVERDEDTEEGEDHEPHPLHTPRGAEVLGLHAGGEPGG